MHAAYTGLERPMVDGIIAHIGAMEKPGRNEYPTQNNRLLHASQEIGRACYKLANQRVSRRDYRILLRPPRGLLQAVKKDRKTPPLERREARMLELGAVMIENRNFPTEVADVRRRVKRETAIQLGGLLESIAGIRGEEAEKHRGHLNGQVAELTTIGLLNYGKQQDHFGILAPPHHERRRKNPERNHDVIFCTTDTGDEYSTQAVQVRVACGKFCDKPANPKDKRDIRRGFTETIALVSAHCDLGMPYRQSPVMYGGVPRFFNGKPAMRSNGMLDTTIPDLLVKAEFAPDELWSSERSKLADLSETLVGTLITEGAGIRAGTYNRGRSGAL